FTSSSYFGLFKKFSTEICSASGIFAFALSVKSLCVMTMSASIGMSLIALLVTKTSISAFLNFFLSKEAPIALDPMPSSQAKITFSTSALGDSAGVADAVETAVSSSVNLLTSSSYFGLFKKFSTEICSASGIFAFALSVKSLCVMTISASAGISLIAVLVTKISRSAFLNFFFNKEAPIALEPMPASQAKMIFSTFAEERVAVSSSVPLSFTTLAT